MKQRAEYRNAIRSRELIKQAFVDLMNKKNINKITVTDIAKKANINRGTFYAHFSNTSEVLEQIENELIETIFSFIGDFDYNNYMIDTNLILDKLTEYFKRDIVFYKKLISSPDSKNFLPKIKGIFVDSMLNNPNIPEEIKELKRFKIQTNFFASGIIGLYEDWFNDRLVGNLDDLTYELNLLVGAMQDFFV